MKPEIIRKLEIWLYRKQGEVSTAVNKPATIGEIMQVVEILIAEGKE